MTYLISIFKLFVVIVIVVCVLFLRSYLFFLNVYLRGAWVAQLVKRRTSAQVTISRFVGSSPATGSVLTAQSLELLRILCLPLSLFLPHSCSVSLSKINKC